MHMLLGTLLAAATSALKSRRDLALENLAHRQQFAIPERKRSRTHLTAGDRLFWVTLSRVWKQWSDALIMAKPFPRGTSRGRMRSFVRVAFVA